MGSDFSYQGEETNGVDHVVVDETYGNRNLLFYSNRIPSRPGPGYKIDEMLQWYGDYSTLENNHSYIQWLFPIPGSRGMNSSAQPLYEHEAKAIREDYVNGARVLMSYKMMLDFYGMRLVDDCTGEVRRNPDTWPERYKHLNKSTHNYRRITRIIASLGELGYERFQVPWITFLMEEAIVRGELPNLNGQCMQIWIEAIKDPNERETMKTNYFELFKRPELCKTDDSDKQVGKPGEGTDGIYSCIQSNYKSEEELEEGTDIDREYTSDREFVIHNINPCENSTSQEIEKEEHTLVDTIKENNGNVDLGQKRVSGEQITQSMDDSKENTKDEKQEKEMIETIRKTDNPSSFDQSVDLITFDNSEQSFSATFDPTNGVKQVNEQCCSALSKDIISIEKQMENIDHSIEISRLDEMTLLQDNSSVLMAFDPLFFKSNNDLASSLNDFFGAQTSEELCKDNATKISSSRGNMEELISKLNTCTSSSFDTASTFSENKPHDEDDVPYRKEEYTPHRKNTSGLNVERNTVIARVLDTAPNIFVCGNQPGKVPKASERVYCDNLHFYQNKIRSKPSPGYTVEEMLELSGNYDWLEHNHDYIQWLFPIQEGTGINYRAQPLMDHEILEMKEDTDVQTRILKAYIMMLDFYGMQLKDQIHGIVKRSYNWKERFNHLNRSQHNRRRITRILKSLGELGYERFQAPWITFLIKEAFETGELEALKGGCMEHWIGAVRDRGEQEILYRRRQGIPVPQDATLIETAMEVSVSGEESDENTPLDDEKESTGNSIASSESVVGVQDSEYNLSVKLPDKNCTIPEPKLSTKNMDSKLAIDVGDVGEVQDVSLNSSQIRKMETKPTSAVLNNPEENLPSENLPSENLLFYQDKLLSKPSPGFSIEVILRHKGDYRFFDEYPCYIQWLFPIPSPSRWNPQCQVLHEHEAKAIREDNEMSRRVVKAYDTVLDYLGLQLEDENFGTIKPVPDKIDERFQFVSKNRQYYRGITRVLTSLGELGYERFQVPLLEFLIREGIDGHRLPTLQGEDILHWLNVVKDEGERHVMFQKYKSLTRKVDVSELEKGGNVKLDDVNIIVCECKQSAMAAPYLKSLRQPKLIRQCSDENGVKKRAKYDMEMQMGFEFEIGNHMDDNGEFSDDEDFV